MKRSFRGIEVYFGRYLTFLTIALFQALFVTLGDIYFFADLCRESGLVHPVCGADQLHLHADCIYAGVRIRQCRKSDGHRTSRRSRRRGRNVPDPDDAALLPGIASVSAVHLRH